MDVLQNVLEIPLRNYYVQIIAFVVIILDKEQLVVMLDMREIHVRNKQHLTVKNHAMGKLHMLNYIMNL